jgi:hypothetical protein
MKWTTNRLPGRAALLAGLWLYALAAHAQNATWASSPSTDSLNATANWEPPVAVPTGIATFAATNAIGVVPTTFAATTFGEILFDPSAPHYNFSIANVNTLTLDDAGIINGSSESQNFVVGGGSVLSFTNDSSAGNNTTFGNRGGAILSPMAAPRALETLKIKAQVPSLSRAQAPLAVLLSATTSLEVPSLSRAQAPLATPISTTHR